MHPSAEKLAHGFSSRTESDIFQHENIVEILKAPCRSLLTDPQELLFGPVLKNAGFILVKVTHFVLSGLLFAPAPDRTLQVLLFFAHYLLRQFPNIEAPTLSVKNVCTAMMCYSSNYL